MEIPCLLTQAVRGLIAVNNDLGLLLALEQTVLNSTLFDMYCILTTETEISFFYQRNQTKTFHSLF